MTVAPARVVFTDGRAVCPDYITRTRPMNPCNPGVRGDAVRGASTHNLRAVDVDIPLGVLVVVTGVAGSGKSSLIHGSVAGRDGMVVDQGAIRGSRRSNPATYTGLLDPIRKAAPSARVPAREGASHTPAFGPTPWSACPGASSIR
jgi:excinuclease UvrABC ATPase subunit